MADYRQEIPLPGFRNLIINPGGESKALGSSFLASNGIVQTGITPALGGPTPASGTAVVKYSVLDNTSLSYFFAPLGPDEPVHRGGFKIPEGRTVSFRTRVRASAAAWVQVQASWLTGQWDSGTSVGLSSPIQIDLVGAPVAVNTAGYVDLDVFVDTAAIPAGATHWRPLIAVFSSNPTVSPTPPPVGLSVYADQLFLPDSGVSLAGIPYGDGEMPGWEWEGEPYYSSSRTAVESQALIKNYVYDPSTADGTLTPWTVFGSAETSASSVLDGTARAIRVERTVSGTTTGGITTGALGLERRAAGTEISLSAEFKVPTGQPDQTVVFVLEDSSAPGVPLALDVSSGALEATLTVKATWARLFVSGFIPEGKNLDVIKIGRKSASAMAVGNYFLVKNIMLNDGPLTTFFDGNTANDAEFRYEWTGTQYASASAKYEVASLVLDEEVVSTDDDLWDDVIIDEDLAAVPDDASGEVLSPDLLPDLPEVPDAARDNIGAQRFKIESDVAEAENVITWRNSNRHLHLAEDIEIQGLVMNTMDAAGVVWVVSDIEGWWTTPEPDVPDVSRAWFDGSYETRGRYSSRTFTLAGSFIPRSPKDVAGARDRLIRAVNLCHHGGWFMTHETLDGARQTKGAKVWLAGQPLIATNGANGKTDFSIALRAPDSLKYGIKDAKPPGYNSNRLLTTSSSYPERPYPKSYPWKYPDAVFGSTNVTLFNEGNASSWPIIRLAGPTNGAVNVFNENTGQQLRITRKLYAGEILEIDCFTRQVTLNGQGNFRFYLDIDVDWLMLQPGGNRFWFSEEVIGTIRTELEILWRSSWIG